MPSLGQNFRFGFYEVPAILRLRAIRAAGFDDTMLWWGNDFMATDGLPEALFDQAVKVGLSVKTAHFPTAQTHALWIGGEAGERYIGEMIAALKACGERKIKHLVMHTTKKLDTPPYGEAGARLMRRAAEAAEKYSVDIAVENTRFLEYNQFLYDNVPSPRMKFCFDSGHANCFTPTLDPLARFGDRLCTMHLHDNNGALAGDEHRLPGEGNVDFERLKLRLAALRPPEYNLESHVSEADQRQGMTMEKYLERSYELVRGIAF